MKTEKKKQTDIIQTWKTPFYINIFTTILNHFFILSLTCMILFVPEIFLLNKMYMLSGCELIDTENISLPSQNMKFGGEWAKENFRNKQDHACKRKGEKVIQNSCKYVYVERRFPCLNDICLLFFLCFHRFLTTPPLTITHCFKLYMYLFSYGLHVVLYMR